VLRGRRVRCGGWGCGVPQESMGVKTQLELCHGLPAAW